MTAPLADAELKHLLNFISYGRLDANVWLLGMEEAGGAAVFLQESGRVRVNAGGHALLQLQIGNADHFEPSTSSKCFQVRRLA